MGFTKDLPDASRKIILNLINEIVKLPEKNLVNLNLQNLTNNIEEARHTLLVIKDNCTVLEQL